MGNEFFDESSDQSQIKAAIVANYFFAWAKVMTSVQRYDRIAYIDLFAGPGRYKDGTASTPLLVLSRAIEDPVMCERLVSVFNDRDSDSSQSLKRAIQELPNLNRLKIKPQVLNKEIGSEVVKTFEEMRMVPTLFFVDPWGYKGLSLRLVNAVVKDWGCECVFFFNYNRVNMGLGNDVVRDHMNALFGDSADNLRLKLAAVDAQSRELEIVEALSKALNPDGKRLVLPFRFCRGSGRTSHHLIFVTKHFLGYNIMKSVMSKQSSKVEQNVASFEYNVADVRYPLLFELNRPLDELEQMLATEFAGQSVSFKRLYESHSIGRPFIEKHYKEVLKKMEQADKLQASRNDGKPRRKGTFPDETIILFAGH